MNILVIKPSSLGDVIHALPFLSAVKSSFPSAQIDWVIGKSFRGLLEGNSLIEDLIVIDKDSWKRISRLPATIRELRALNNRLRAKRYDAVVDLQGLLRSGLMAALARTPLKIGFADAREGSRVFYDRKISSDSAVHAVDRCLEAASILGAKPSGVRFPLTIDEKAGQRVEELTAGIDDYIMVVPSSRWKTKQWPPANFASVLSRIDMPVVMTGTRSDSHIAEEIMSLASATKIMNLCGRTDLKELVALTGRASVVLTNDSGPMHIAAALNRPIVAIFGPTDPEKTGPYGWKTSKHIKVVRANVPCSPCRRKSGCPDFRCMEDIQPERVINAIKDLTGDRND
jgi:lipopolysaccharide heptosyltransferase I